MIIKEKKFGLEPVHKVKNLLSRFSIQIELEEEVQVQAKEVAEVEIIINV